MEQNITKEKEKKRKETDNQSSQNPGLANPVLFLLILFDNAIPDKAKSGGRGELGQSRCDEDSRPANLDEGEMEGGR